jgi:MFS family permease
LSISTKQFGLVVSAYAFSAGLSGFLTAGFADRFDRKKLLLVFYTGFVAGTIFCGLAPDYPTLLVARIVTGLFGGVVGSISFAILADVFPMQMRGRAMGIVQTAFAASQIAGIPWAWCWRPMAAGTSRSWPLPGSPSSAGRWRLCTSSHSTPIYSTPTPHTRFGTCGAWPPSRAT